MVPYEESSTCSRPDTQEVRVVHGRACVSRVNARAMQESFVLGNEGIFWDVGNKLRWFAVRISHPGGSMSLLR